MGAKVVSPASPGDGDKEKNQGIWSYHLFSTLRPPPAISLVIFLMSFQLGLWEINVDEGIGEKYPLCVFPPASLLPLSSLFGGQLGIQKGHGVKLGGVLTFDQELHRLTGERPCMCVIGAKTSVRASVSCAHRAHGELRLDIPISALWAAGSSLLEQKEGACCCF